jgi:hypothetical protein
MAILANQPKMSPMSNIWHELILEGRSGARWGGNEGDVHALAEFAGGRVTAFSTILHQCKN